MEELNSVDELKDKCKEYLNLNSDFKETQLGSYRFAFVSEFCVGRNKVSKLFNSIFKLKKTPIRKLNLNGDETFWNNSARFLSLHADMPIRETYFPESFYKQSHSHEEWKAKAKDFCRGIEWNKEKHELNSEQGLALYPMTFKICTDFNGNTRPPITTTKIVQ